MKLIIVLHHVRMSEDIYPNQYNEVIELAVLAMLRKMNMLRVVCTIAITYSMGR
jgi:hypothetical protein